MNPDKEERIRTSVRARYARAARGGSATARRGGGSCCGPVEADAARGVSDASDTSDAGSCCGPQDSNAVRALDMGYSQAELGSLPEGANLGLGCGNPSAIASLRPGETVLDLGSGAGVDCFLAARQVGSTGRVIGVDMTPEMLGKARANASKSRLDNVTFRLGEIENLPVADGQVDVIISNCVINLSPDKPAVFGEAYRVLKGGGRLAIADMVATVPLPASVKEDGALWSGCVAGAATVTELEEMLRAAGFQEIHIRARADGRALSQAAGRPARLEDWVVPATIEAVKPAR